MTFSTLSDAYICLLVGTLASPSLPRSPICTIHPIHMDCCRLPNVDQIYGGRKARAWQEQGNRVINRKLLAKCCSSRDSDCVMVQTVKNMLLSYFYKHAVLSPCCSNTCLPLSSGFVITALGAPFLVLYYTVWWAFTWGHLFISKGTCFWYAIHLSKVSTVPLVCHELCMLPQCCWLLSVYYSTVQLESSDFPFLQSCFSLGSVDGSLLRSWKGFLGGN